MTSTISRRLRIDLGVEDADGKLESHAAAIPDAALRLIPPAESSAEIRAALRIHEFAPGCTHLSADV